MEQIPPFIQQLRSKTVFAWQWFVSVKLTSTQLVQGVTWKAVINSPYVHRVKHAQNSFHTHSLYYPTRLFLPLNSDIFRLLCLNNFHPNEKLFVDTFSQCSRTDSSCGVRLLTPLRGEYLFLNICDLTPRRVAGATGAGFNFAISLYFYYLSFCS